MHFIVSLKKGCISPEWGECLLVDVSKGYPFWILSTRRCVERPLFSMSCQKVNVGQTNYRLFITEEEIGTLHQVIT